MSILGMSLSIPSTPRSLSSVEVLSGGPIFPRSLCLTTKLSQLSLTVPSSMPCKMTTIRMGGGPRTYPGGVSKWQWKRMQAKKAKQLLKARLARERSIYEMRKRAELKAAVSELERPWETVEKPPNLFSVSADEQVKVLADRFQKAGGIDLWSENDGPELFRPDNGLPSARFFPKGVVHSIKPYRSTEKLPTISEEFESLDSEEDSNPTQFRGDVENMGSRGKGCDINSRSSVKGPNSGRNMGDLGPRRWSGVAKEGENRNFKGKLAGENRNFKGKLRKKGSTIADLSDSEGKNSGIGRFYNRDDRSTRGQSDDSGEFRRSNSFKKRRSMNSEVFDMSLRNDGSYGFELDK